MSVLHVSLVCYDSVRIKCWPCPTCRAIRMADRSGESRDKAAASKSFMVVAHAPWLGTDATCLRCGEHWQDGVRADRPFERGWRKKSIKAAKDLYRKHHSRTQATINS
jgi:hypothetical protein